MRDWTDQPEASGPLSESDLSQGGYGEPGRVPIGRIEPPDAYLPDQDPAEPEPVPDPAAAAIERNLAAEADADAGKTVPADALVVTS